MDDATLQRQARALGEPTRHRIWRYIGDAEGAVGVAELTEHLKLNHNAIRQHLGKLVAAGLLTEEAVPTGRPGRPALQYRPDPDASAIWGGSNPYEELAGWLVEMIDSDRSPEEVGREAGRRAATRARASNPVEAVVQETVRMGFQPTTRDVGGCTELVLGRCPFVTTATSSPLVVCGIHRGIAQGILEGLGVDGEVELAAHRPETAGCVLRLPCSGCP